MDAELTADILVALAQLMKVEEFNENFKIHAKPIAGEGENSYGLILQVEIIHQTHGNGNDNESLQCIVKIAPKNPARRSHMRVVEYYAREVFMYDEVFKAYRQLVNDEESESVAFMACMLTYSLKLGEEFIVFEDLTRKDFVSNQRVQLPTYPMVAIALGSLAKFHGLSFALQAKQPELFKTFVTKLQPDNLFTPDIEPVSIEFGKSYVRRARKMLEAELPADVEDRRLQTFNNVEENFKAICLHAVNGAECAPYAVICHGDFWNNNILNYFDQHNKDNVLSAKLIDFQMSRYASPILDLIHYLFICTEHDLRQQHFESLLFATYYNALAAQLRHFDLDVLKVYPRNVFEDQLRSYGIYGLCMAAFSLPFFVADRNDLPDMDAVSEAIVDISGNVENYNKEDDALKLIEEDFNMLTPQTAKHFKRRMVGIVNDVIKFNMKTSS